MITAAALAIATSALLSSQVTKFAILAGNDSGLADEPNLRYAERDAARLGETLIEVGNFPAENVLVLRGRDASTLRRALIALNDRIRTLTEDPGVAPLIFVYFSGHSDAKTLHLGDTKLELAELEQLVRGSAARFRLLLLDSCRSGSLTQVKGGSIIPPFPIHIEERLEGEGVVFLTSSAASEDAQESEELGGSFFTHYFISALLGAADGNADGRIALREAYAYAYEHTLRASSRTLAGPQHPTFRYEIHGKNDLVLSEPYIRAERAVLEFPEARGYLVLGRTSDGPVIAEVGAEDRVRRISVAAGKYFLRSRGRDHLLEGTVTVAAGERRAIREGELERFAYARLVRKGGGASDWAQGTELGYRMRGALFEGAGACHGMYASHGLDFAELGLRANAGFCRGESTNETLRIASTELALELSATHSWDLEPVTVELGAGGGIAIFHQRFDTRGEAPSRWAAAPLLSTSAAIDLELGGGFYLATEISAAIYLPQTTERIVSPVMRGALGAGKHW